MLTTQIINDIKKRLKNNNKIKIIYVGDPAQLPPINQIKSDIFNNDLIERIELTNVIRTNNNTIINCGYRRSSAGRGGSINFEQNAAGMAYNNLIVNCKFGPRVVQSPLADTAHIRYGYNFQYGDSLSVVKQFVPNLNLSTAITAPQPTDIPNLLPLLPSGWKIGDSLSNAIVAPLMGTNNPMFVNGPVPMPAGANLQDIAVVGSYSFRLKAASPCIGKGFTGFTPKGDVPVDAKYGVTELTSPGKDIGAYQYNGTGNQH